MKCNEPVKIFTVRGTSFEAAPTEGGSAASEDGTVPHRFIQRALLHYMLRNCLVFQMLFYDIKSKATFNLDKPYLSLQVFILSGHWWSFDLQWLPLHTLEFLSGWSRVWQRATAQSWRAPRLWCQEVWLNCPSFYVMYYKLWPNNVTIGCIRNPLVG